MALNLLYYSFSSPHSISILVRTALFKYITSVPYPACGHIVPTESSTFLSYAIHTCDGRIQGATQSWLYHLRSLLVKRCSGSLFLHYLGRGLGEQFGSIVQALDWNDGLMSPTCLRIHLCSYYAAFLPVLPGVVLPFGLSPHLPVPLDHAPQIPVILIPRPQPVVVLVVQDQLTYLLLVQ